MTSTIKTTLERMNAMKLNLGYSCHSSAFWQNENYKSDLWINPELPLTGYLKSSSEKHIVIVAMNDKCLDRYQYGYPVHKAHAYQYHKLGTMTTDELNDIFNRSVYLSGGDTINVWLATAKN